MLCSGKERARKKKKGWMNKDDRELKSKKCLGNTSSGLFEVTVSVQHPLAAAPKPLQAVLLLLLLSCQRRQNNSRVLVVITAAAAAVMM